MLDQLFEMNLRVNSVSKLQNEDITGSNQEFSE